MTTYVLRNGRVVEKITGEPLVLDPTAEVMLPQLMRDIPPYRSPLGTGEITSRSQRREDMKRGNCVEAPPLSKERREMAREADVRRIEKRTPR